MTDALEAAIQAEEAARSTPEPAENELTPQAEPEVVETESQAEVETAAADEDADPEAEMAERIKRSHIEAREAKRRARQLEAELQVLRGQRTETRDEQVQREAQELARQMTTTDQWTAQCNRIAESGRKDFQDFNGILQSFREQFPEWQGIPAPLIDAAMEAAPGDEHKVLRWLGQNMDEAERISTLNPARAGAAVAKIAENLKPKPKPVSKAPAPIKPVAGGSTTSAAPVDLDKMTMAQYVEYSKKKERERRAARLDGW